ncbi:hypothetical protein Golob_010353 [Gossypium lobatum]|uniref:Uncharacterized protein n=2 Tax=Gossypium TaxID=3633 RepID=A0A7J8XW34_GOSAI|nr:hypothetical protein [Gossypium lobatum]MBA0691260.1 hypothetical protein [Gossypium aridum]
MAKDILYMQTWGEVAPALLISRQRSSSSPRLETIVEEERGGVRLPKRVIVVLPILLSLSFWKIHNSGLDFFLTAFRKILFHRHPRYWMIFYNVNPVSIVLKLPFGMLKSFDCDGCKKGDANLGDMLETCLV